jgi:hypothetical protein
METKICSVCKKEKLVSEFYKNKYTKTGLKSECKICHIKGVRLYQKSEKGINDKLKYSSSEKRMDVLKKYNKSEKRKISIKKYDQSERGLEKAKKFRISEKGIFLRKKHKLIYNKKGCGFVDSKVRHAIKHGLLIKQPCEICNSDKNIEAHHQNYSLPLDVVFLCRKHHKQHHAELRRMRNG